MRRHLQGQPDRPRLCVHRSHKQLYIQVIDDQEAKTLFSASTLNKELNTKPGYGGNITAAQQLGDFTAEKLKQKGIIRVVFDRGGYLYHGRIKALAESLKKAGVTF